MTLAQDSRTGQRATPRRAERSARQRVEIKPAEATSEPQVREWLVERARERIESGFYDDPLIVEAAIAKAVRQAKPAD